MFENLPIEQVPFDLLNTHRFKDPRPEVEDLSPVIEEVSTFGITRPLDVVKCADGDFAVINGHEIVGALELIRANSWKFENILPSRMVPCRVSTDTTLLRK